LLSALENHQLKLENSPLLRTSAELDTEASEVDMMKQLHADDSAAALKNFKEKQAEFEQNFRVKTTLSNLQQLALYLSGVRGRKNVIWLSGAFPSVVLPDSNPNTDTRDYSEEIRKTTNLLAASEISLYPIDGRGLMVAPTSDAALTGRQRNAPGEDLRTFETQTNFEHESMKTMARETGGIAFTNTNAIAESVATSMNDGTNYYSIAYTPTNKSDDGRLRKIEVKLDGVKAKLAYRRVYFARDSKKPDTHKPPNRFDAAMQHGLPQTNQIVFTMHAMPADSQLSPNEVADKPFKGTPNRYQLDFVTNLRDFTLGQAPDGLRHGTFVVAAIAYGLDGDILNSYRRELSVSFNPQQYTRFLATGMQIHENLDLPVGEVFLRTGIYDISSEKIGTFEVPLTVAVPKPAKPAVVEAAAIPVSILPDSTTPPSVPNIKQELSPQSPPPTPNTNLGFEGPLDDTSIASYCKTLANGTGSSAALASACQFALSLRNKLPNVICDRKMKRHSRTFTDVVTATVNYKDGLEHYSNLKINGKLADQASPGLSATWSSGEFSSVLEAIFAPVSHASFRFVEEAKLHKTATLLFEFRVKQQNNTLFFLHANLPNGTQVIFFPSYLGFLWLAKTDFSLVRLERRTSDIGQQFPISEALTQIDYAKLPLGDGTDFVLATHADVFTCSPDEGQECSHNIVKFANWHKFGAKSRVVAVGDEQP
jgi:VWFA-related protein